MAEERIKQHIKTLKRVTGISKPFAAVGIEELERVLQILADYVIMPKKELKTNLELLASEFEPAFKVVDMGKWCELLKLRETRPNNVFYQEHLSKEGISRTYDDYLEKIEEKLEELGK